MLYNKLKKHAPFFVDNLTQSVYEPLPTFIVPWLLIDFLPVILGFEDFLLESAIFFCPVVGIVRDFEEFVEEMLKTELLSDCDRAIVFVCWHLVAFERLV